MKTISICVLLLIVMLNLSSVSAYDAEVNILAGEDIVTPQHLQNDTHFLLYNDGYITYSVYMYDYTGMETYRDSFVGSIKHDQGIILNNNASYIVYADYDNIRDFSNADIILEKVFNWWNVVLYGLILIIGAYGVYRIIRRR
jgi:hypothetical protein